MSGVAMTAGTVIDRYQIERVLGEGGMGIVYAARDGDLGRTIAIKLVSQADADERARARLLEEARAMAKISHPKSQLRGGHDRSRHG